MGRPPRTDAPGAVVHVTAGGVARRTIFETVRDVRKLLALTASKVRAGRIEVLVFSILMTHFHILLRSVDGTLSRSMQWILDGYARYFNRTRQREGHVFGARFFSKVVESATYFETLVYYIDRNPVEAALTDDPTLYPFGSAQYYREGRGPIWLSMDIVKAMVDTAAGTGGFDPRSYGSTDRRGAAEFRRRLIERRLTRERLEPDPLDALLIGDRAAVVSWMQERARLADGNSRLPGLLLVDSATVLDRLGLPPGAGLLDEAKRRGDRDLADLAIGLLRTVGGCGYSEMERRLGVSRTTISRRAGRHSELLRRDDKYAERVAEVFQRCLRADHPQPHLPPELFSHRAGEDAASPK